MDQLLAAQREAVRSLSAVLFGGAQYRLEVCGALQSGERITAAGLAERLGTPPGKASVHMEVQRLENAALLTRLPRIPGDRHAYFKVKECSLWEAARELAATARATATVAFEDQQVLAASGRRQVRK